MNYQTIIVGSICSMYALFVLILRLLKKESMFKKLGPMKEKFGSKAGSLIHYLGYVLVPFVVGVLLIFIGMKGQSIFDLF